MVLVLADLKRGEEGRREFALVDGAPGVVVVVVVVIEEGAVEDVGEMELRDISSIFFIRSDHFCLRTST